ncbi:MAG: hypothetical protein K9G76_07690 [Bacteroidales bacterium]|nr:hypothetical protein [Bacteroidales bacterium]MCF8405460.1 hypothetical protein [Bacteroidales bacterium]
MEQKSKNIIETIGTISKKETLASFEEDFCNGILILENKFPFPGYYHATIPDKEVLDPGSFFLVTKNTQQEEEIMRLNHDIKKIFQKKFDTTVGEVTLFNEIRPCIRVKHLSDYHDLPELVKLYQDHGVHFLKFRKVKPYDGLIRIRKYFLLESPEPGFYTDVEDTLMCYIQIPAYLKWIEFEKITLSMKRNMDDIKWDAALGTIYRNNCLVDMVRIYDEHIDREKVMLIKSKYLEAVKKTKIK